MQMRCVQCGTQLDYPTDFPDRTLAICRPCTNINADEDHARAEMLFVFFGFAFCALLGLVIFLVWALR
jgi:hypothetical protein